MHGKNRFTGAVGVLVFLGVLIALNALVSPLRLRKDFTQEGLYTLSEGTKKLLADLPRDVTFKFYSSRNVRGLPMPLKQYAQRILDLLREYERQAGGRLKIETYDPKPDSDEEEWAQRYGVAGQNLGTIGLTEIFYLGLVAVSGPKDAVIPFFSPSQEPQLEYLLTRMIAEVTAPARPKIGVITTLPIMGMGGMNFMQRGIEPWAIIQELKAQYEVVQIPPQEKRIPDDIRTVLVIHPRDPMPSTLFALDQFVLRGGRLIVFQDPASIASNEILPNQDMAGMMRSGSDLNGLTRAWGIEMIPGKVVADLRSATPVRFQDGRSQRNPTWLSLRKANLDASEIITSPLEFVLMPFAGAFQGEPAEGLKRTPLIQASPDAGLMDAISASFGAAESPGRIEPATNRLAVAVRLTGKFKTAFPDGDPTPSVSGPPPETLKEGTEDGVVILVGDVDLLYDRFAVERINFFGRSLMQVNNDNLAFALNAVEQLSGNPALIGLRSRGTYERPFDRVIEMESAAQARWQEEELKLQDQLQATQSRLNELESTKDKDQRLVMSAEQQKEIANFRAQAFETRRQLKEVRKNLRGDIERLGIRIKTVNIAAMPIAVTLFGIAYGLRRRRRAA